MQSLLDDPISITLALIAVTVAISLVGFWALPKDEYREYFLFVPSRVGSAKGLVGLVLSHFSHADIGHLAVNMLALYFFGPQIELALGPVLFLALYAVSGIAGTFFVFLLRRKNPRHSALGASGCIAGVVFAVVVVAPTSSIMLLFLPIPIPAPIFGVLYLVASSLMMGRGDHVAHEAHLGGAIAGFAFAGLTYPLGFMPLIAAGERLIS